MQIFSNFSLWASPSAFDMMSKIVIYLALTSALNINDFAAVNLGFLIFSYLSLCHFGLMDGLRLSLPTLSILRLTSKYDASANSVLIVHFFISLSVASFALIVDAVSYFEFIDTHVVLAFLVSSIFYCLFANRVAYFRFKFDLSQLVWIRLLPGFIRLFVQFPVLYFHGLEGYLLVEATIYIWPSIVLFFSLEAN